jgi:hypothetical protein
VLKGEILSALLFAQMANLRRVVAELRDTPCIDSAADEETEEESFDEIAPDVKEVAEYEEPAGNFEAEPVEDVHEDAQRTEELVDYPEDAALAGFQHVPLEEQV